MGFKRGFSRLKCGPQNKLLLYENLLNLRATGPLQLRFRMVGWLDKERNLALSLSPQREGGEAGSKRGEDHKGHLL